MQPLVDTIAFVCQPYHRGGVTRWMADAAMAFAARGYRVFFVTVTPSKPFYSGTKAETITSLLKNSPNPVEMATRKVGRSFEFGSPEYCMAQYASLLYSAVPVGTPIIMSDDGTVWMAGAIVRSAYPIIGVLHGDDPYYYKLANQYGNLPDVYACVSGRISGKLKASVPAIDASKIYTIPCGIILPAVQSHREEADIIKIIYVGRIAQYPKRIFDLLEIAKRLLELNRKFHITIVGDGLKDRIELEQKIQQNRLTEHFTFTGWLQKNKVEEQLQSNDILVLTSEFEGTSVSMMESLANGCGFAGSRVSGAEDYEHNQYAKDCFRIFNIGDIEQAVSQIISLAAIDPGVRVSAARKMAESEFGLEVCLDRYEHAISRIPKREYVKTSYTLSTGIKIKSLLLSVMRRTKMKLSGR